MTYLFDVKRSVLRAWNAPVAAAKLDVEFAISPDGCVPWLRTEQGTRSDDAGGIRDAFAQAMPFDAPPAPIAGEILLATFSSETR